MVTERRKTSRRRAALKIVSNNSNNTTCRSSNNNGNRNKNSNSKKKKKKKQTGKKRVTINTSSSNSTTVAITNTTTNNKSNEVLDDKENERTSPKEAKEAELRDGITKFYLSPKGTALDKFCKQNNLGSKAFGTRWKGSGLKELKSKKKDAPPPPTLKVAMEKYDEWYTNWQEGLRQQRVWAATNDKTENFTIHIDEENDIPGTNDTTGNNACSVSSNDVRCIIAGAGDDNISGYGDAILCASYAVGKCKVDSPVVHNLKAHVCSQCKKPMHAICGIGERPTEVCFACNDTNNDNTNDNIDNDNINSANDINNNDGDRVSGDSTKPKVRARTLSWKELRDFLISFYLHEDKNKKLGTFTIENDLEMNIKAIRRHWTCSGLAGLKSISEKHSVAFKAYDEWLANENRMRAIRNRKNGSRNQAIPDDTKVFLQELIKQLAFCGQGLPRKVVEEILFESLNKNHRVSRRTLDRYMQQYDLRCRGVKNIDPIRIAQVTTEKRDLFFHNLDAIVKNCHEIDEINCPWESWEDVDADCKSNIDEMSSDPTSSLRDKIVVPKELHGRIFQQTPQGDKNDRHVTIVAFSSSDGKYKDQTANIDGAAPPIIIHAKGKKKVKDTSTTAVEKRMELYDNDPSSTVANADERFLEGLDNYEHLGIKVLTSVNGSMTKELFPVICSHIIEHLRPDQGIGGKYTFILMDSHISRWNPKALYLLFLHRVIPIFFPSHLTIVVQPQDNGVILYLHKCLEDASLIPRLFASSGES